MSDSLKQDLVTANRIAENEGIVRTYGHLSVREPGSDRMYISRARAPGLVTEDDILTMTLDGKIIGEKADVKTYGENVIHRAIYRHRDDVNAVIHHHAHEIMPFTITDIELKPSFLGGQIFHPSVPKFEDYDEEYGRLIVTEGEADRMAKHLGDGPAQLLEGHGANVVGNDLQKAMHLTTYLLMNARYQYQAMQLGDPTYTGPPDDSMLERMAKPGSGGRMWEYLAAKVGVESDISQPKSLPSHHPQYEE